MKYSSAVLIGKEPIAKSPVKLKPLHQCERCKCYDDMNLKAQYEWLKPFNGYVQTPLCHVCIGELKFSMRRK